MNEKFHYKLSYHVTTVDWNDQYATRRAKETYEPEIRLLKSLGVDALMLTGYVWLLRLRKF